jgi:hypothetical protein
MRIGETLKKAAGLFVELPDERPGEGGSTLAPSTRKTVEEVVRGQPGPNLDEIKVPAPAPAPAPKSTVPAATVPSTAPAPTPAPAPAPAPIEPIVGADGQVSFGAVYRMAKLPNAAFTAEQVLELLASLPAELPIAAKRTTLKVTLDAMSRSLGVSAESVVADASRKLAALASCSESYGEQATQYVAKARSEIAALEAEIRRREQGIAEAERLSAEVQSACTRESERLDDVLEFFSLDVPPSKYAQNLA